MEYLIMGDGEMPLPEMRAAVDELLEAHPEAALDVLDNKSKFVDRVAQYWSKSGAEVYFYDEDADPKVVLLLTAESNFDKDEYWEILDSLKNKVKVYAFNEQMYEIVPTYAEEAALDEEEEVEADPSNNPFSVLGPADEPVPAGDPRSRHPEPESKMNVVGDMEVLDEMTLAELKRVAKGLGVEPEEGSDRRSKDSWLDAIKTKGEGAFGQPLSDVDVGEALYEQTKADNKEAFREAEQALVESIGDDGAVDGALVLSKEKAEDLRAWVSDTQILLSKIASLLGDF